MPKRRNERRIVSELDEVSRSETTSRSVRKSLLAVAGFAVVALLTVGVFAQNGWWPTTDPLTGQKTGWFGKQLPKNASSSWNPFAAPLPDPTPQLSKIYIYAGSRLLAVEDANANPAPPADLAVWRSATGTWWVMGGQYSQGATQGWGLLGDKPVPGDYDGDGKTDFSVFRPSTGEWFVLQSSDGSWLSVVAWGNDTDELVPADYDGDGKTDRAVWRPSDGTWYVVRSSDGTSLYQPYGTTGDRPAPADYDGDGRADIAVWRNSNQSFYSLNSSNGATSIVGISQSSSEPVSADYDGDGKADHAVRSGPNWHIRQSSSGQMLSPVPSLESSGDKTVHNDYDGDGKVDIAVWRPTDSPVGTMGKWYIRQSTKLGQPDEVRVVQWGILGDLPVPAFYRR